MIGAGVGALLFSPINRPGAGAYLGGSGVEIAFSILVLSPMVSTTTCLLC